MKLTYSSFCAIEVSYIEFHQNLSREPKDVHKNSNKPLRKVVIKVN